MSSSYTPGYSDEVVAFMRRRTGATHGGFFLPLLQGGMHVLDCGCGPGSITLDFARVVKPGKVIGIDQEPRQFTQSREEAADENLDVVFQGGSVYDLPFDSETFDAVFAHGLFSHLTNTAKALSEIRRVLKGGGLVGLRDADWGGALVHPSDDRVDVALKSFSEATRLGGGEPEIGRRLGAMLKVARFENVRMSASYEVYHPALAARYLARFTGDGAISPDLFLAQPWCEALGNQPRSA